MSQILNALRFRTIPNTVLVCLVYIAIFAAVFSTDRLHDIPRDQKGLNITEAYADLHQIAARPHHYNSHANDIVHEFILSRVREVESEYEHVKVIEDLESDAYSMDPRGYGIYFQGTNILIKIDGTDDEAGAVLFSAHYDCVSTAPGATDDGMGVATLIQLVEYFAAHRPRRTAVFNINNGEEDWLNGAVAFLRHPWSNLTDTFLNLEGASSGGRPLLFRVTSTAPILSFAHGHVPHPHANVLSADAFSRGTVRSGTDYSVYTEQGGMEGLDLAFYRGRSKYHTKYDSIPYTEGQEKALWAMMEAARGSGIALLSEDRTHSRSAVSPVYFDLFGNVLIVFPKSALFTFNIVLLIVAPLATGLLIFCERSMRVRHATDLWTLQNIWTHAQFWVAMVATLALEVALVAGYLGLNPLIIYSEPYMVMLTCMALAYLSWLIVLVAPRTLLKMDTDLELQKEAILLHMYIFTWFLLVGATVALDQAGIGALYFVSAWNTVTFLAWSVGAIQELVTLRMQRGYDPIEEHDEVSDQAPGTNEPNEATPLIRRERIIYVGADHEPASLWWILQLALAVPLPVVLVAHIALLVLGALPQTLADGNSALFVYAAVAILSTVIITPLAPFSLNIHRSVTYVVALTFVVCTAYAWVAFPFSEMAPLKVYFQQRIYIDSTGSIYNATTILAGHPRYVRSQVLPALPSATDTSAIDCSDYPAVPGAVLCSWTSDLFPTPSFDGTTWFNYSVERTSPSSVRFNISGENTRNCRIYIGNHDIDHFAVEGGEGNTAKAEGVRELRLWSRTWPLNFTVDVSHDAAKDGLLSGQIACQWVEYESASTGVSTGGKIPAIEEALAFLPKWSVLTKASDGLVEVLLDFSV
ncbi:hypothetical protein FISHEDRAFT_75980 [Fistulina hepatica ATCC 64428]|uniref:Peptide hydrolase n=1 Tax=Fistulina hepatica ATCC 64428 TaxID=1128425 RepID=A0A0D7A880_9AGAR|nr:hypothetical protein FISHEDRAFT_75980 [Fistulina hepatica ATCC 64428]